MRRTPIVSAILLTLAMGAGLLGLCTSQKGIRPDRTPVRSIPSRVAAAVSRVEPEIAPSYEVIRMKVTAYCICSICCGEWSKYAKTSTGDDARVYDGVAADPKLLPYRTKLEIPGVGIREVDDTGGGMRQSAKKGITHIDVRMPSHEEARRWGVRWLEVKVLN